MLVDLAKMSRALVCLPLALGLAFAAGVGSAVAQETPSVEQIIEALKPKHLTRSLDISTPPSAAESNQESQFLDVLSKPTRSLTEKDRGEFETLLGKKRGLDFEINFGYGSAKLAPAAMPGVRNIGEALSSAELKGDTFVIAGYTDAKGGTKYNQRLSERRAEAVERFLLAEYKIPAKDLKAIGFGKSSLKNPSDPFGAENRRVRVTNTAADVANE